MKIGEVKKWKKAVFQEEESKLVGSNDQSIDFASNIFENENGKEIDWFRVQYFRKRKWKRNRLVSRSIFSKMKIGKSRFQQRKNRRGHKIEKGRFPRGRVEIGKI